MKFELRVQREKLGFTQQEIGDLLGLSTATISDIESGQHSYYRRGYEKLLVKLGEERLHELVQVYPRQAGGYLGELASTRGDQEEPPNSGLDRNSRRSERGKQSDEIGPAGRTWAPQLVRQGRS